VGDEIKGDNSMRENNNVKKFFAAFILFLMIFTVASATASPTTEWEKMFAALWNGRGYDEARSITEARSGGYVIGGWTDSTKEKTKDVYLVKVDENGGKSWERRLGGSGDDLARSILATKDGGYIVAGSTWSTRTMEDAYVIKTDWDGNKLWERVMGGDNIDRASAVDMTSDGGYIVAGSTWSYGVKGLNPYIIRLDRDGLKRWEKLIEGFISEAFDVHETGDGNFIIAGYTRTGVFGYDPEDAYLIKIDGLGKVIWSREYGGSADDRAYSVDMTSDGGYILAGWTESYGAGGRDIYVIKTDADGEKEWEKTYGKVYDDEARSVLSLSDGGYIVTGFTSSSDEEISEDLIVLKFDSNGEKVWEKTYGGIREEIGYDVIETQDHRYVIAGMTHSYGEGWNDCYVIKLELEQTPPAGTTDTTTPIPTEPTGTQTETEDPFGGEPSGFGVIATLCGISIIIFTQYYYRKRMRRL